MRRNQMRPCRAQQAHVAEEFQPEALVPIFIGELKKIASLGIPGAGDNEIQPTVFFQPHRDQQLDRARLEQVGGVYDGLPALCAYFGGNGVEVLCAARSQHEFAAFPGERAGDAGAYAAARARDNADLIAQIKIHDNYLCAFDRFTQPPGND
jgi:hypothetical protein